jgi:hypothetical protein
MYVLWKMRSMSEMAGQAVSLFSGRTGRSCFAYPFITPIGRIRATSFEIPAPWHVPTTSSTSLYASGISSASTCRLAARA